MTDQHSNAPKPRVVRPEDVTKVAVGSRAEAKALRRRAEDAAKARAKATSVRAKQQRTGTVLAERARADATEGIVAWSIADAAVMLSVVALTLVVKNIVLGTEAFSLMPASGQVFARAGVLAVFYALQLGTLAWLAKRHGAGLFEAFGLRRLGRGWAHHLTSAGLVLALLVATRLGSTLYGAAAKAAGWEPPSRAAGQFSELFGSGGAGLALAVLMVVILGPFTEELIFRGVLLRAVESRAGVAWAIVIQAAFFAAYHLTPWIIVPSLMLGLACGWLAWQRRTLWPAIVLHALYNGAAVAAAFYLAR